MATVACFGVSCDSKSSGDCRQTPMLLVKGMGSVVVNVPFCYDRR